jgi:5-methyltetrahydropteroyltriglutamate--homocysteine methyltransferase
MSLSTILGFPRIGKNRELKSALEAYWKGKQTLPELEKVAADLRSSHWQQEKSAGLDLLPSNDFSYYDQMLDMAAMLGVVPARYGHANGIVEPKTYFAMARGAQRDGVDVPAAEMTKWFDTNYHYIVPEFVEGQIFRLASTKVIDEFVEAKAQGLTTRPVLIGPLTFLLRGKGVEDKLALLDSVLPVYADVLRRLEQEGAEWVQLDEPSLVLDQDDATRVAYGRAYAYLRQACKLKLFVTTYFGSLDDNLVTALKLPIDALHLDRVRGKDAPEKILAARPAHLILSLGVVDGRNIWRNNLSASLAELKIFADKIGQERVWVAPSCSLLHAPYDLSAETLLDAELKEWLAFAVQKLHEVVTLSKGLKHGRGAIAEALAASDQAVQSRQSARRIHNPAVKQRLEKQPLAQAGRLSGFAIRQEKQRTRFGLPLYPTTTIGSFPQTMEVRKHRADVKNGRISAETYDAFLREEVKQAVTTQEELGIDVLVHGEFERNDMVEYFGEQLAGFAFTKNGWVQSYGSRCVKPPIIYGDVSRPKPMTVRWSEFAQSLTSKPMKGMLTGPVTILQWSFVRDDQPRSVTTHQIALALQDEVLDLEKAGIHIIQIDEPAFREGLPLRRSAWPTYLTWAAQAFRLSYTGVADDTQIHTHMCYCEFNDIIDSIKDLDADVISIETSRSQMELLDAFTTYKYPNDIGPGVYDIHSPRVPEAVEMARLLEKASEHLDAGQIWVNPDCGLKTRDWPETKAALQHMVTAARQLRARSAARQSA